MKQAHKREQERSLSDLVLFCGKIIGLYFAIQAVVVTSHEYAHSTMAWLLGVTHTPNTVVWGNPLTITGWDEGVPYDQFFRSPGHPAEAAIGFIPLVMHATLATVALWWLLRRSSTYRRWLFYAAYMLAVVNFTELVAYLAMRPFAGSGDTGRFNEGLNLSPWPLFIIGNLVLLVGLGLLSYRIGPKLRIVVGSNARFWCAVLFTSFMLFLGGSGLRIMALYPDRQWKWGLVGVPALLVWLIVSRRTTGGPNGAEAGLKRT